MKLKRQVKTGNPRFPVRAVLNDGTRLRIPQQKEFNSFCQAHGCSMAAVVIALQFCGVKTNCNKAYRWCKANISGYTGSKLTIYGVAQALNKWTGRTVATHYNITSKNKTAAIKKIRKALEEGKIVLLETTNPVHTNVIIATRTGGVWNATNGKLVKTTIKKLVKNARTGTKKANWWPEAGGYVVVDRG